MGKRLNLDLSKREGRSKMYVCNVCNFQSFTKEAMKTHVRAIHGIVDMDEIKQIVARAYDSLQKEISATYKWIDKVLYEALYNDDYESVQVKILSPSLSYLQRSLISERFNVKDQIKEHFRTNNVQVAYQFVEVDDDIDNL